MPRIHLFVALLLLLTVELPADEQVRAVQEELRRRNVYFGDIDGRRSAELQQAMKRYQSRKGFAASGTEDRDTLRSLGLLPRSPDEPPPKELDWPQEPVLKSDERIDVVADAREIAAESGVSVASLSSKDPTAERGARPSSLSRRGSRRVVATPAVFSPARGSSTDQRLDGEEVRRFVDRYLKAVGRNDVRGELEFYADRVDYYKNGSVDRRIIERNLQRYYQRWPSRSYSLGKVIGLSMLPARGEIVVTFQVKFALKSRGRTVRGQTDNRFTINAATADPRIVSIQESRVRL